MTKTLAIVLMAFFAFTGIFFITAVQSSEVAFPDEDEALVSAASVPTEPPQVITTTVAGVLLRLTNVECRESGRCRVIERDYGWAQVDLLDKSGKEVNRFDACDWDTKPQEKTIATFEGGNQSFAISVVTQNEQCVAFMQDDLYEDVRLDFVGVTKIRFALGQHVDADRFDSTQFKLFFTEPTPTRTNTSTAIRTPSATPTATSTEQVTATTTATATVPSTATPTVTDTPAFVATLSGTPSVTNTPTAASETETPTPTQTATITATSTGTATATATHTSMPTPTDSEPGGQATPATATPTATRAAPTSLDPEDEPGAFSRLYLPLVVK